MRLLLTCFILSITLACSAQDTTKNLTLTKVETEARYPGGDSAWFGFLAKNFDYPYDARVNLIQGTVVVQFIVDTDGNLSDIHAISGPEKGGLREEAVRVVKLSGKWEPGIQNGHKVRSYQKTPLMFKLGSD
jgi:protein TonB